jgi:hypothetical protein
MSETRKRNVSLGSTYLELWKEALPYQHHVEALLPVLERLGYDQEGAELALKEWRVQDQEMLYWMGCCCSSDIEAMWFLVQAGRQLCGINRTGAIQMLEEAISLIKEKHPKAKREGDGLSYGFDYPIKGFKVPK